MTQLIEIGSPAFNEILSTVAKEAATTAMTETEKVLKAKTYPEFVKPEIAMEILGCGATKFQELRDNNEIEYTNSRKPMYVTESLFAYLRRNTIKKRHK
jgi:hypothetical protein